MRVLMLILDTETGGVNKKQDGICQTVAVLYNPATDERDILLNARSKPRRPMADGAIAVHGVTNEMCEYHPTDTVTMCTLKMMVEELEKELEAEGITLLFSGYNSQHFDMPFMDSVLGERFFALRPHVDMMRLMKKAYPAMTNHKLSTVYQELTGKNPDGAHDAAFDCLMVADLIKITHQRSKPDWEAIAETLAGNMVLTTFPNGKHKGVPYSDIPADYLEWVVKNYEDGDARHSAIAELRKRGVMQ